MPFHAGAVRHQVRRLEAGLEKPPILNLIVRCWSARAVVDLQLVTIVEVEYERALGVPRHVLDVNKWLA